MYILNLLKFGVIAEPLKRLKITIPEDLDYERAFADLFSSNLKTVKLSQVKTTAMGSLYQLTYEIEFKNDADIKAFIDDLRCRNGNLNISLNLIEDVVYS
jgi:hypothetical protein